MKFQTVEEAIINGVRLRHPVSNGKSIEKKEGYYSIWIVNLKALPVPFNHELVKRKTTLLYIGIASNSLHKRLYQQELQHKSAATFFRSIGAVLGYTPEQGSLVSKKNQNNYKFNQKDTNAIIEWININPEVSFHYCSTTDESLEKMLIAKYKPLLNWTHNPEPFLPLKQLKDNCRAIARRPR
ncbi:MAG: hypothetical protein K1X77_11610 [Bacteroidia bacterium]|nr:hypothetical protein [Bacteroidia bacterium]MBX7203708.1 hypothetical protein [Bacteroidia bacterium]